MSTTPSAVGAGFDFADPNSRLAPYYLQAGHVVAVAMLAAVYVLVCHVPLWHTDVWGHLKFGQWIYENHCLPETDPFCPFADATAAVNYPGQLGQVLLYAIFHAGELAAGGDHYQRLAGGVEALRFSLAAIVTLRLAVLFIAFRRVSGSLPLACCALAVLLVLSVGNIAVIRPQIFGELLFAMLLLALSRPLLSWPAVIALPILLALWANVHGSFGAGLMLIASFALGRMVEVCLASSGARLSSILTDPQLRRLVGVLCAAGLGIGLFNPAGFAIYGHVLALARHPVVALQDEWQPLSFRFGGGGHWSYLALVVLLAATQICSTRWFSATTLVLIAVFGLQPLLHQRMLIWGLMVFPWILARYGAECNIDWLTVRSVPSFRKTLLAAALVVLAVVWSTPGQWAAAGGPGKLDMIVSGGTGWRLAAVLRDSHFDDPAEFTILAKELQQRYPDQKYVGCIFASETLGDYLLWQLAPEIHVFIYSHVHLFDLAHWQKNMTVRSGSKEWRRILDSYKVNLVVVEPVWNPHLCDQLRHDGAWRVILDESNSTAKLDPRNRLFVALRAVPLLPNAQAKK